MEPDIQPSPQASEIRDRFRTELGLLPIPLREGESDQYVLYNGSRGNFCLDLDGVAGETSQRRSMAWSSNVGHYLAVLSEDARPAFVEVQRWDHSELRRYSLLSVLRKLKEFYEYLEHDSPPSDRSVVSHVLRVYRLLRTEIGLEHVGLNSLKAFLLLLAASVDEVTREEVSLETWSIDEDALAVAQTIDTDTWQDLMDQLRSGVGLGLRLDLHLVLRHASGLVFQEAHYEVYRSPQRSLPGLAVDPVEVTPPGVDGGLHFTPPPLARTLVEEALHAADLEQEEVTVFDPACGSGEFLREAHRQLRMSGFEGTIQLIGWDISPAAIDMTRFSVGWEIRGDDRAHLEFLVTDSLRQEEWPIVDIVTMNPPFGSWNNLESAIRDRVSEVMDRRGHGKVDLAHAFMLLASQCLDKNGVLAVVMPASAFDSASASGLRSSLGEALTPTLIARLGSHQLFPKALVDAGLYVGVRADQLPISISPIAFWADHRSSSNSQALRALRRIRQSGPLPAPEVDEGYSVYTDLELGTGTTWSPRPYRASRFADLMRETVAGTVGSVFNVNQGARTGSKKEFIVSKVEVTNLPSAEQAYFRPCIVNKSIRNGVLLDDFFAFYPYDETLIETEAQLFEKVPTYAARFLEPVKERLAARSETDPAVWWGYSRYRRWQSDRRPRLVSTYFGSLGAFSADLSGKYVVIQGFAWSPKGSRNLSESSALAYVALLNSPLFGELLYAYAPLMGGGQWDLSKRYVDKVPIPDFMEDYVNSDLMGELAAVGKLILRDGLAQLDIKQAEYDRLVAGAYGFSEGLPIL